MRQLHPYHNEEEEFVFKKQYEITKYFPFDALLVLHCLQL